MPLLVCYQVKNLFQGIDWKSTVGRAGKMKTLLMIIVPIAMVHGRRPTIATPSASLGTLMTSENNIWASFSVWLRWTMGLQFWLSPHVHLLTYHSMDSQVNEWKALGLQCLTAQRAFLAPVTADFQNDSPVPVLCLKRFPVHCYGEKERKQGSICILVNGKIAYGLCVLLIREVGGAVWKRGRRVTAAEF